MNVRSARKDTRTEIRNSNASDIMENRYLTSKDLEILVTSN